jgi:hypothetical protein
MTISTGTTHSLGGHGIKFGYGSYGTIVTRHRDAEALDQTVLYTIP